MNGYRPWSLARQITSAAVLWIVVAFLAVAINRNHVTAEIDGEVALDRTRIF